MKSTHLFFSLSFLFACSFMAHAMEVESSSSDSHLELIKQAAKNLAENKRGIPTLVTFHMESNRPCCQKVLLVRKNGGKEIDTKVRAIINKDWQRGEGAEQYILHLAATNTGLNVSEQTVDEDGNLITLFEKPISFNIIKIAYCVILSTTSPEIEDIKQLG